MRFYDFFAGIGGFRFGLERAGHVCVGASEVSDFPRAVYEHRFGHAPAGDMTQLRPEDMPAADLWCGGWPCQGLSQAGLRKGIFGDPRSNLIWPLLDLADACEANGNGPTWLLLENVPGLLNGKDYECGEDVYGGKPEDACPACGRPLGDAAAGHVQRPWIGEVFGALADRGWRWAWRVLDAQFFGLAQHRERIFILARRAGASGVDPEEVLLEPGGVRGDPRASRAQGQEVAGTVTCGTGSSRRSHDASGAAAGHLVAVGAQQPFSIHPEHGQGADLRASATDVAPALTVSDGRSERGVRVVEVAGLIERHHAPQQVAGKAPDETDISPGPDTFVAHALGVRRLTPRECERLMGFPDDWTLVPNYVATLRGKRVSSDTKRYEALGNSVAVPVVEWIGRRLKAVEKS